MYNRTKGDSKTPIRLSGKGRSCLIEMLGLGCLGWVWCYRRFILAIQPGFSLENRTCTWKRGHGRHWYVRKKPSGVDIWGYVNACILLFLFIIQTLKFFTLFIFHYFLFILMFPFCLHATSALYKPITIFFCIIKRFWIFDMFLKFLYVLDVNKNKFYCNIWSYLIVKRL